MVSIKELRLAAGWTIREFSEYFGVPYRTVQNWEGDVNKCPGYLVELMEYKMRKEGFLE